MDILRQSFNQIECSLNDKGKQGWHYRFKIKLMRAKLAEKMSCYMQRRRIKLS